MRVRARPARVREADKHKNSHVSCCPGETGLKKGKKMPSIELEGHSEAHYVLKDGKIVKVDGAASGSRIELGPEVLHDRAPKRPGE